ncbi:MAG: aldehyde dehydrogenase family protein [Gemmatimonadales bacterium]|nr:MAG: aldehyde dehydrogenase family protein [Gemmatimonadales bacterium]
MTAGLEGPEPGVGSVPDAAPDMDPDTSSDGPDAPDAADAAPDATFDTAPDRAGDPTPPSSEPPPPPPPDPWLRVSRPFDRARVGEVPVDDAPEVEAAVQTAREAQLGWGGLEPRQRVRHLAALRREIARWTDDIVDRIVAETGKPDDEALVEVFMVQRFLRWTERHAPAILADRRVPTGWMPRRRARIWREPLGVVGVISPWNYPFILSMEPVAAALACGNAAVLKPSEHTPFTGALVRELAEDAGLPSGLVQVVQGRAATGRALVQAGLDHLHFTGGPDTARAILADAAPLLLPTSLELGGKDPALVLADANLERAARGIAFGALSNAGQTCLATERVYVEERVHERFLRILVRVVSELRVGSGGDIDVGPMTLDSQLEHVERQVNDAVGRGARVLCGGERIDPASNVFLPTVLADVPDSAQILREETFGPVIPVVSVADVDEAIRRANAHPMGLFASIWTGNVARGRRLARALDCGGVSINDTLSHWGAVALPFGGRGESGASRLRGEEGLHTLSRSKAVLERRGGGRSEPWWFPYGPRSRRFLRAGLGLETYGGIRGLMAALVRALRREET